MARVVYQQAMAFPVEVLIPMRLLVFNGGARKLVLRGGEQALPAPIASWLQTSVEHGRLIATVEPVEGEARGSEAVGQSDSEAVEQLDSGAVGQ